MASRGDVAIAHGFGLVRIRQVVPFHFSASVRSLVRWPTAMLLRVRQYTTPEGAVAIWPNRR
jgi:hypothetical protein